jgi:uncharacterized protein YkwD
VLRNLAGKLTVAGKSVPSRRVKRIVIATGGGGDVVWVGNHVPQSCKIFAGAGNDWVHAGGGPTEIYGSGGNDTLLGGLGHDVIYGGEGKNHIFGGWGHDAVHPGEPHRAANPTDMAADVLQLLNQQRTQNGLQPLTFSAQLVQAANLQAGNMVQRSNAVGPAAALQHTLPGVAQPTLSSRLDYVGFAYQTAGENIAFGYTSANDVMKAWLASPTHRDNLLSTGYVEIGIGIQADAAGRLFFCQVFATPK